MMARKSIIADVFKPVSLDLQKGGHAEYFLKGGRGSTKSSFISIEIIIGIMQDEHANAIIYRRVANTIKDSVYEQMIWAIDTLGLTTAFRCRKSPFEIERIKTGQRILFRGADDPMKSKSIKLKKGHYFKYLWFEEVAEFRGMEDIRTIKQSILRGVDRAFTLYSYNPPKSAQNWVNAEAMKIVPGRMVHTSNYLDVPPEWLGEAFINEAERLLATNERAYRNEYLGEVTGTGGHVFDNLNIRNITDKEMETFGATYAGLDFGWFPDPAHFVRCAYAPSTRKLWIYDEFRTVKTSNRDIYEYLKERKGLTHAEEVIADSAEMKSVADMRSYGMRCIGATKGPGSVRTGIRWLQTLSEIIIDPVRCPETAKEFLEYEYEKDRDGNPVDAYPDEKNHSIDAVRYALNRIWQRRGM
jgi:PBSX family phage terminase large subunit